MSSDPVVRNNTIRSGAIGQKSDWKPAMGCVPKRYVTDAARLWTPGFASISKEEYAMLPDKVVAGKAVPETVTKTKPPLGVMPGGQEDMAMGFAEAEPDDGKWIKMICDTCSSFRDAPRASHGCGCCVLRAKEVSRGNSCGCWHLREKEPKPEPVDDELCLPCFSWAEWCEKRKDSSFKDFRAYVEDFLLGKTTAPKDEVVAQLREARIDQLEASASDRKVGENYHHERLAELKGKVNPPGDFKWNALVKRVAALEAGGEVEKCWNCSRWTH